MITDNTLKTGFDYEVTPNRGPFKSVVGIDFDDTISSDPELYVQFMRAYINRGHKPCVVTARDPDKYHGDINQTLGNLPIRILRGTDSDKEWAKWWLKTPIEKMPLHKYVIPVFITGHNRSKGTALNDDYGFTPDVVWDDRPEGWGPLEPIRVGLHNKP